MRAILRFFLKIIFWRPKKAVSQEQFYALRRQKQMADAERDRTHADFIKAQSQISTLMVSNQTAHQIIGERAAEITRLHARIRELEGGE